MEKIVIEGGRSLVGDVSIGGSKNSALPLLAASILCEDRVILENIPDLKDIDTMCLLLTTLGAGIERKGDVISIDPRGIRNHEAPYEIVKQMRASILVLGPLVARFNRARISLPGGCAIGLRPVDLHLMGLQSLGAKVDLVGGYIEVSTNGLSGGKICLDFPSVGATENLIMASTLAKGVTVIEGVAKEPEIWDLVNFLKLVGARIEWDGGETVIVEGVEGVGGGSYRVMPDRIQAATFMVAGAITGGNVKIKNCRVEHLGAVLTKLCEAGVKIDSEGDFVHVLSSGEIRPFRIKTMPYPGFPTDMQAQFTALASIAHGTSLIMETIFENRFMHTQELARMGADIQVKGNMAVVKGVRCLSGAPVMATDLRASAALVLAGLVAHGRTEVLRAYHLDRGYENLEKRLAGLGANIWRERYG